MDSFTSVELCRLVIAGLIIGWLLIYMTHNHPPGGYIEEKAEECESLERARSIRTRK